MTAAAAKHRLAQLAGLLGLARPAPGTLGLAYLMVLLAGSVVAVLLGRAVGGEADRGWGMLISLILWQPLIEELLFRGVLQGELLRFEHLAKPFAGVTAANVVVSCLFGAIHLVNQSPGWALAIILPSLVFGYFRDRSSSVVPGLALHVVYNGVFFLVQN